MKKRLIIVMLGIVITIGSIAYAYLLDEVVLHDQVITNSIPPIESTLASNRYTQVDDLTEVANNPYVTLDDHQLIGSNSEYALYVNQTTLSLRVLNLRTNYIWGSNMNHDYLTEGHPLYRSDNPGTNIAWDLSPVSISYFNTNFQTLTKTTEYFFDGVLSGTVIYENLTGEIGFKALITMPRSGIKLTLIVYLNEDGLNVLVPFDSVKDHNQFLIATITVYRNFGFTPKDEIPGYVMIPDGIGALIRYSEKVNQNFSKKFYGPDYAFDEDTPELYLRAGIYGSVQGINQNAMLVILKDGAANGTLVYNSHAVNTLFNKIYVTFEYRDKYVQKLNAAGTNTIERIQAEKNNFDIHLIYQFLSGNEANYVGFASSYRDFLIKSGVKIKTKDDHSDTSNIENITLHLDVIATENRPVWYGRETFTMTSVGDLVKIINDLKSYDINSIKATIHGWNQYGWSRTTPNFGTVESKFGSPHDLNELDGVETYYEVTPTWGYQDQRGFSNNDIAIGRSRELIMGGDYYVLKPRRALEIFENNANKVKSSGVNNFSFEDLDYLYSEYANGVVSKTETGRILAELMSKYPDSIVNRPYDLYFDAKAVKEIDLYSSNRLVFTDTVPVLSLILSGQKEVFGRSANYFANTQNELLRMIDYQVLPSFVVSEASAQLLIDSDSRYIFTSKYQDWQSEIVSQYHYVNDALKYVSNASVVSRVVLTNGVVLITYDNGVSIYVNYGANSYTDQGILIAGMSYEVVL